MSLFSAAEKSPVPQIRLTAASTPGVDCPAFIIVRYPQNILQFIYELQTKLCRYASNLWNKPRQNTTKKRGSYHNRHKKKHGTAAMYYTRPFLCHCPKQFNLILYRFFLIQYLLMLVNDFRMGLTARLATKPADQCDGKLSRADRRSPRLPRPARHPFH
jgi:hypothetical protein